MKTGKGKGEGTGEGVEAVKPARWKVRSSAIWCGSLQVENKLTRLAGSSYRFSIPS